LREKIAALGRPLRVLSADDNTTNQIVVAKMLQPLAVQVDTVGNGIEAVTAVSRFAYDLVLMDMRMPEMDGLQATRTIRSGAAGADVPIVAVTANAFADDVNACFDAGMNDFVVKPIRKRLLVDAILRVLRGPEQDASQKAVALTAKNPTLGALPEEATMDNAVFNELVAEIGLQNAKLALSVFIAETDQRLERFRELSCDVDKVVIEREAHTLKGAAGNFGLRQVSALARLLEYGTATITSADYEAALTALGKSYAAAREQCARLMADAASAA
jgi:CheY-like chemotaxis protein/HPt (histidine-containing phosphotransfer) domain-containing protein